MATGIREQVELAVEHEEAREVVVVLDLRLDVGQPFQLALVQVRDALDEGERLEPLAHLVDERHLVHVEHGHSGALVGLQLDKPFGREHPQRLTHRKPADPEPLGDLLLPDAVARGNLTVKDPRAQVSDNVGAERPSGRDLSRTGGCGHRSPPA